MSKSLLASVAAAGVLALGATVASPAFAFFTECTATKNIEMLDRPQGMTMGRWLPIEKGQKVAVRDTYQDWYFVLHYTNGDRGEYGWVQRATLTNCQKQDGTP
jgi:hypothetical protein